MLKRKILGFRQFKPSFAHSQKELEIYEKCVKEIFNILVAKKNNKIEFETHHDGFMRLTKE
jgi:hypothetical protein